MADAVSDGDRLLPSSAIRKRNLSDGGSRPTQPDDLGYALVSDLDERELTLLAAKLVGS